MLTHLDISRIACSFDGTRWSLRNDPIPAMAELYRLTEELSTEKLLMNEYVSKITPYLAMLKKEKGKIDHIVGWRFQQLGFTGFAMIFSELNHRANRQFDLKEAVEAENPIWSVINNRRSAFAGIDPLLRHATEAMAPPAPKR